MEVGPKDLTEATQAMESYRERLVGLVASGRSMTDMDVVRLSQEVDGVSTSSTGCRTQPGANVEPPGLCNSVPLRP